jgi:hypothetical protein
MTSDKYSGIIIRAIAMIEIAIGLSISMNFIVTSLINPPGRPKSLYGFVIITSLISIIIGIGLYRYKNWARQFLIFFAGYVILTKLLLATNLVDFTGNTIKFMSVSAKDILSFLYHGLILIIFNLKTIKQRLT